MTAIPLPTNITGLQSLGAYMNTATSGWFWIAMILTINIISFLWLSQFGFKRAAATSLFLMTMLVMPLRLLGYVGDNILFTYGILTAMSIVLLYYTDEGS